MDSLSALSLASAIVQFVDFGFKLLVESSELYRSPEGALADNVELKSTAEDLLQVSAGLRASFSHARLSEEEVVLRQISASCEKVADELLAALDDLMVKGQRTKWKSTRRAFRSIWKEKQIREIEMRLDRFRGQLMVRLLAILRYMLNHLWEWQVASVYCLLFSIATSSRALLPPLTILLCSSPLCTPKATTI